MRFKEIQKFRQPWLWTILLITALPLYYQAIRQLFLKDVFATYSTSESLNFTFFVFHLLTTTLLFIARLEIEINQRYLSYQFFPFHLKKKSYALNQLQSATIRKFHPIKEMTLWGLYISVGSKSYHIKGRWGVQLEFVNGRQLLLGTQKPIELNQTLKAFHIQEA